LLYLAGDSLVVVVLVTSRSDWAHGLSISIAAARGIGNIGLGPQFLSLYPVWALVLLNLAYWHTRKPEPSDS
jgi:hypothetical protein